MLRCRGARPIDRRRGSPGGTGRTAGAGTARGEPTDGPAAADGSAATGPGGNGVGGPGHRRRPDQQPRWTSATGCTRRAHRDRRAAPAIPDHPARRCPHRHARGFSPCPGRPGGPSRRCARPRQEHHPVTVEPRPIDPLRSAGRRQALWVLGVLTVVILTDQLTKAWAWRHLPEAVLNTGATWFLGHTISSWYRTDPSGGLLDLASTQILAFCLFTLLRRPRAPLPSRWRGPHASAHRGRERLPS